MNKFTISFHAFKRFRDYIDKYTNIEDVLAKAKLADTITAMTINTEYSQCVGSRKFLSNKDAYFVSERGDVVFACLKTGIKSYFVQTCWVRQGVMTY